MTARKTASRTPPTTKTGTRTPTTTPPIGTTPRGVGEGGRHKECSWSDAVHFGGARLHCRIHVDRHLLLRRLQKVTQLTPTEELDDLLTTDSPHPGRVQITTLQQKTTDFQHNMNERQTHMNETCARGEQHSSPADTNAERAGKPAARWSDRVYRRGD